MAFSWTQDIGNVALKPALEQMTRGAVIAACEIWQALPDGAERPRFAGTTFVVAQNQAAEALAAACLTPCKTASNIDQQTILATAVHAGEHFFSAGRGEVGWSAMTAAITRSRTTMARRYS